MLLRFLSSDSLVPAILPLFQWLDRASVIVLISALLYLAFLREESDISFRSRNVISLVSMGWAFVELFYLVIKLAYIFEGSVGDVFSDLPILKSFIIQVRIGQAIFLQIIAGFVIAIWTQLARTVIGFRVLTLFTAIALLPPALTGHSGSSSFHQLAVTSWGVHILAITFWCAGVTSLVYVGVTRPNEIINCGRKFSRFAFVCSVATVVSGIVNAYVRISFFGNLFTSRYGQLLLAKIFITLIAISLGAFYRVKILNSQRQNRIFFRLLSFEVFLMALAVMLGVVLSATSFPRPI